MSENFGDSTSETLISKQAEEAIQKAYAQTELLLSSITSILIGVGENGLVTHWNAFAEKTFGIPASRVLNQPFSECKIQWDAQTVFAGIKECQQKGAPIRLENVSFLRPNGQKGFLGITIIPLRHDTEGQIECILYGADITERRRMEQLKDEFVSTVSHELRTPLTIIKEGVSQVLEGILGKVNEEQKRFLSISLEGIDRLGRIVDDLLDISKIEAGKLMLKREAVDISSLVKGIGLAFNYQVKEKGLKVKTSFPNKPVEIYVDRDKIIQVFTNLISNALKFTDKGKIEISVVDKGDAIECSVSDTGRGIAQEDLPRVFSKFQQFHRGAGGVGERGTGLGLAICKGIVELHHGTIQAVSRLGEGTKFTFTLPKISAKELFRDQIARSLGEAIKQESSLSVIVFDLANFDALKEKMGSEQTTQLVKNLEGFIKQGLSRQMDVAIKDARAILVILPNAGKEEALIVAGRIQQTFDNYLSKRKLKKQMEISCKVATFPADGNTAEELLNKVEGS